MSLFQKKDTIEIDFSKKIFKKDQLIIKFIPSDKYIGSKLGYLFYMGDNGLGYYLDHRCISSISVSI